MEKIGKHVLVVDDEIEITKLLKDFLSEKGYRVSIANNGYECLEIIKKDKPLLVLLDVMMPGMDGVEVLKGIKKLDEKIGVVMITGAGSEETGKKSLQLGASDYIAKPFDLKNLELLVEIKTF